LVSLRCPRFGWLGAVLERAELARWQEEAIPLAKFIASLPELPEDHPAKQDYVWNAIKRRWAADAPTGDQSVQDSPSWALKHALDRIAALFGNEKPRWIYAPWITAVARNQVAQFPVYRDGLSVIWAIQALNQYGALFEGHPSIPSEAPYIWPSAVNRKSCQYKSFFSRAAQYPLAFSLPKTLEECIVLVRECRVPVLIASYRGFHFKPGEHKGRQIWRPCGVWPHAMCLIEYDHDLGAMYRLSSWGPNSMPPPPEGETPGGAWNLLEDLEKELSLEHAFLYVVFPRGALVERRNPGD